MKVLLHLGKTPLTVLSWDYVDNGRSGNSECNCKMIVLQMAEFSVMYDEVTYHSLSTLTVLNHVLDDCFFVVLYFVLKIKG